jgi:hypothetical protein
MPGVKSLAQLFNPVQINELLLDGCETAFVLMIKFISGPSLKFDITQRYSDSGF